MKYYRVILMMVLLIKPEIIESMPDFSNWPDSTKIKYDSSKDAYFDHTLEGDAKIATTKISYSEAEIEQFDIESAVNYVTDQISNLPRLWRELEPSLKQRFQKLVFPKGISYERNRGFRTTQLGCIYEMNRQFVANNETFVDLSIFDFNQLLKELKSWWELRGIIVI